MYASGWFCLNAQLFSGSSMKTVSCSRPRLLSSALALLMAASLGLAGCIPTLTKKPVVIDTGAVDDGPYETRRGPITAAEINVDTAEAVLRGKDMARAEQIATRLSSNPNIPADQKARVSRVLAVSAAACNHPYLALKALDEWKESNPHADESFEWQRTYAAALEKLPVREGLEKAKRTAADESRPLTLRYLTRLFDVSRTWDTATGETSMAPLAAMYASTRDVNQRAFMERSLFTALNGASPHAMEKLEPLVTDASAKTYPAALVQLEKLRRMALNPESRAAAAASAEALAKDSALVDTSLLQAWDATAAPASSVVPVQGRTVVLALPLTEAHNGLGARVVKGAQEAVSEFAERGYTIRLLTVDTNAPDWLEQMAQLPPEANIVGGPLFIPKFNELKTRGVTQQRVVMSFTPSLGTSAAEGVDGWRFFASSEDQINALLTLGDGLGISSYSILKPSKDSYAAHMTNLFTAHVKARGGHIAATAEYPSDKPSDWHKIVGGLSRAGKAANPASQAVFLPDSWKHMEVLGEFLNYFQMSRQVMMGASLWEQGLRSASSVPNHFSKGVFPGPWKRGNLSPAAERLSARFVSAGYGTPDFWSGLGYDFVRFASTISLPQEWDAAAVNTVLSHHRGIDWAMAPITWTREGRASQHLFLFSPMDKGISPLTPDAVTTRFGKK